MHLYKITATFPAPERGNQFKEATAVYRGIVGESDPEALVKAHARHVRDGHSLTGASFKINERKLVVPPAMAAV
ncbi:hypothetical protein [Herminiimonas arsenitoxidans]|uniref:hypothetical protein n=1 Tax=Herminiimonas arsenitoxidans TaxID=1809410 RepID=UPI000970B085|nr:hypothetical protein [Herminiimonas arsenitoxidans]